MAVIALVWAIYDRIKNHPTDALDLVISIWTMLLDVVVIIAMNHDRKKDKDFLKELVAQLNNPDKEKK